MVRKEPPDFFVEKLHPKTNSAGEDSPKDKLSRGGLTRRQTHPKTNSLRGGSPGDKRRRGRSAGEMGWAEDEGKWGAQGEGGVGFHSLYAFCCVGRCGAGLGYDVVAGVA